MLNYGYADQSEFRDTHLYDHRDTQMNSWVDTFDGAVLNQVPRLDEVDDVDVLNLLAWVVDDVLAMPDCYYENWDDGDERH